MCSKKFSSRLKKMPPQTYILLREDINDVAVILIYKTLCLLPKLILHLFAPPWCFITLPIVLQTCEKDLRKIAAASLRVAISSCSLMSDFSYQLNHFSYLCFRIHGPFHELFHFRAFHSLGIWNNNKIC